MKTLISLFLILLFAFQTIPAIMTDATSIEQDILQSWKETFTYEINATSITRECITANAIDNTVIPFRITTPGLYCVTDFLIPNAAGLSFVISVETDNVVVDLNENFIQASGVGTAIIVNGRQNIVIRGGTIRGNVNNIIGGNGISISNGSRILLDTLTISNCTNGIFMSSITEAVLTSCALYNNTTGMNINNGQFFIFNTCVASRNGQGFVFNNCANFFLSQCFANINGAQGFLNSLGRTFQFINCTSNANNQGFVLDRSTKDSFVGCTSTDNTTYGLNLNTTALSVINVTAKGNNIGFNVQGSNNILFEALAQNNAASGFLLNTSSNFCLIRECVAQGNNIGFNNLGTNNRFYTNFAENNTTNFVNVPNVVVSPTAITPINFTANIEN